MQTEAAAAFWQGVPVSVRGMWSDRAVHQARRTRCVNRRIGMSRRNRLRKVWIGRLLRIGRQGAKAVISIVMLGVGILALGAGVAGVAIAIVEPASGGMQEGRSAAGGSSGMITWDEGGVRAGAESWEPRGKVRVCRNWCEKGGSACVYVCGSATP